MRTLTLALACAFGLSMTAVPAAADLLWQQQGDGWAVYYPTQLYPGRYDAEIADDFDVVGSIDRVLAAGYPAGAGGDFRGLRVRFYAFGGDGNPGALQAEYFLAPGDPKLVYDPASVSWFEATLDPPFSANGRHFVVFQPEIDYLWAVSSANRNSPRGSAIRFRDSRAGGGWGPFVDIFGVQNADFAFSLYGTQSGTPLIASLSASVRERSGRLVILGSQFGGTRGTGQVLVDGVPAWVSTWTENRIVAYVSEEARLGPVGVVVATDAGSSPPAPLEVTARAATGRVRWQFEMDASYSLTRPALGADGTLYMVDVGANLYAISPDGALLWLLKNAGNKGVDVGVDGTIYTAGEDRLLAVRPGGSLRWTHDFEPRSFITLGPNVGPDGNVYAVCTEGEGIVSYTPEGVRRWATPERYDRPIVDYQELTFGPQPGGGGGYQMYFHANNHFSRVPLESGERLEMGVGGGNQPVVGPDGTVYEAARGGATAYEPDGTVKWRFSEPISNAASMPAVGTDGRVHFVANLSTLDVLSPSDGSLVWRYRDETIMFSPGVAPDGSTVVLGGRDNYGLPGQFRGFSDAGRLLFQIDTDAGNGIDAVPEGRPRFSDDSRTAYVSAFLNNPDPADPFAILYAIDATLPSDGIAHRLDSDPVVRGTQVAFRVSGLSPGESVTLYGSRRGTGPGPCVGGGLCLDILPAARIVGTATADASGVAIVRRRIPAGVPRIAVHLQAVGSAAKSSVLSSTLR